MLTRMNYMDIMYTFFDDITIIIITSMLYLENLKKHCNSIFHFCGIFRIKGWEIERVILK